MLQDNGIRFKELKNISKETKSLFLYGEKLEIIYYRYYRNNKPKEKDILEYIKLVSGKCNDLLELFRTNENNLDIIKSAYFETENFTYLYKIKIYQVSDSYVVSIRFFKEEKLDEFLNIDIWFETSYSEFKKECEENEYFEYDE